MEVSRLNSFLLGCGLLGIRPTIVVMILGGLDHLDDPGMRMWPQCLLRCLDLISRGFSMVCLLTFVVLLSNVLMTSSQMSNPFLTRRPCMCQRINDLRRERIRALATPQAAPFYQEDSMKVVSMSRITERHFWDVFHRIPLSTSDPAKWKNVLKHLDS